MNNILYSGLKYCVALFFNALNLLSRGNLPMFACASVIVEEQGSYLVVERQDGELVFPGGFTRWREHPAQTAQREGHEETGFQLHIGDALGYYSVVSDHVYHMSTLNITYVASVIHGDIHHSIEGRVRWCDEKTLRTHMNAYHITMLEDYLRYKARQQEHREKDAEHEKSDKSGKHDKNDLPAPMIYR